MVEKRQIANQSVTIHSYNTVIVGSGAAGMNCAVHLYEFMSQKGVENPQERIAVVTAGIGLGASRMSGSDKQTYYKMGTSPDVPDSAEEFAKSLTAAAKEFFDHRTVGAWVWRITVAAVAFVPIYLFFGSLVAPLTAQYFQESMYGLRLPSQEEILLVLLVRSGLFLLACLPIIITWRSPSMTWGVTSAIVAHACDSAST